MILWTWNQVDEFIALHEATETLGALVAKTYEVKCKRCKLTKQFHAVGTINAFAHGHLHGEDKPFLEVVVKKK